MSTINELLQYRDQARYTSQLISEIRKYLNLYGDLLAPADLACICKADIALTEIFKGGESKFQELRNQLFEQLKQQQ